MTDEMAPTVPYQLAGSVEGGRVVMRGTGEDGATWMISMTPAAAVELSLRLPALARAAERMG